jgi:hypothetical protein
MAQPDETAEWEADEPDTATDTPADITDEQPADPPPGMKYDSTGRLVEDGEPRSREQRYRQQLRATEAERDQLRERLDARDRADVERMIASKLIDPSDLWAAGVTLADLVDDSGELQPALVDEAVERTVKAHPHWRHSPAAPSSMVTSPHGGTAEHEQPTWQSVFQAATRPT